MADYPAMPLWTDAYLADTRHLSTIEHGAYMLLLMEMWRRPDCSLPDDDRLLARLAGLSEAEWAAISDVLKSFFQTDKRSKTITQKRLSAERVFVAKKTALRRDAAAKRWKATEKDHANALQTTMQNGCKTDAPTPTPTPTPTEITANAVIPPVSPPKTAASAKPKTAGFSPPDWVPEAEWAGFVEMRRLIGAPLTDRAAGAIIRRLEQLADDGHSPGRVLDQSTRNAWRDVFAIRESDDARTESANRMPAAGLGNMAAAVAAMRAERLARDG